MARHQTLDELSPSARVVTGLALLAAGAIAAAVMHAQPGRMHVPAWLGYLACLAFVVAATAIALHPFISGRAYGWLMVLLLATMATISAWLALGDGRRECRASLPFVAGDIGCRIAFGAGAIGVLLILVLAVLQALRSSDAD